MSEEHLDALVAVRRSVAELVSACPGTLHRMRVRAGDALVEVEWSPSPGSVAVPHSDDEGVLSEGVASDEDAEPHYICAATVGTFHHSLEPGAKPFVAEGDIVDPGQQVGVLEVMKLMTPVESDRAGRVVEIIAPDAHPVEYGQRLIALAPVPPG